MNIELAWAAGFFDGEGCINLMKRKNGNKPTLQLAIGQSYSKETLERFYQAVGNIGKVYGPYKPKNPNHGIQWKYRAHGDEARKVVALLEPYLCTAKLDKYSQVEPQCAYSKPDEL